MLNPFFKNYGPIPISEIIKYLNIKVDELNTDQEISDIKDLSTSNNSDITFFHSKNIKNLLKILKHLSVLLQSL